MRIASLLTGWLLALAAAPIALGASPAVPAEEPTAPAGSAAPTAESADEPAAQPATTTTGEAEPTYPYTGKVTADLVNIRCGSGMYYYPLTTLSKGDPVVVEGETEGWLAIRPPEGVFGLMRRSDLAIGQDGTGATVTAPKARMYMSSGTAERQWCVAGILEQGDRVAVLGPAEGEFVRVTLPTDARAYIVDEYVTASAAGTPAAGAGGQAADDVEVEPLKANPLVEAYEKASRDLRAEQRKELDQREYEPLLERFKEVAEKAEKAFIKKAAERKAAYVENLIQEQAEYRRVISLPQQLDERLADIKTEYARDRAEQEAEERMGGPGFVAQGMVRKLQSLEGTTYPIKYKLVDQNNRPLVVLKSSEYDLGEYVGKVIGVRGSKEYVKDWRIYCVTVDDLEMLE